jgi:ribonuclease HII
MSSQKNYQALCDSISGHIAGVDEVGRGPLAGDVVAAAVIFPKEYCIEGLADSKKLTEKKRETLFEQITSQCLAFAVGRCSPQEIDEINILQASLLAMKRAVDALSLAPDYVMVDGNQLPKWSYPSKAVIGGDHLIPSISAASIIAKVTRDNEMKLLDEKFPAYGFGQHKGYPTKSHLQALASEGPCEIHRISFKPVKAVLVACE